jgi:integrase
MSVIDRHFKKLLEYCDLRYGVRGQTRTLYSLRHTAITFRLLYGKGIDLLTLAKNARTSVEMIEKHYASELTAEMNVGMLHSRR